MANATPKQSRRTVRSLSVQEKVQAIDRVHDGESKASVARDLGVPESTLRGWCKGEEKLRGIVARSGGTQSNHNTSQSSCDETEDRSNPDGMKGDTRDYSLSGLGIKRDFSCLQDKMYQTISKKYPKLDNTEVPDIKSDLKSDSVYSIHASDNKPSAESMDLTNSVYNNNLLQLASKEAPLFHPEALKPSPLQSLPALAAIASAISNKQQLMYQTYTNSVHGDCANEEPSKPLDYSVSKLASKAPRPEMNEALMYWLQAQREQATLQMSPMEGRTADTSSWFWKWYKNYGVLPQVTPQSSEVKSNGITDKTQSEDEDEPPATASDALHHGEKFLRWLECCSDPSVTALQILQFRYLLNNVKSCAERKARQHRTKTRSRRK